MVQGQALFHAQHIIKNIILLVDVHHDHFVGDYKKNKPQAASSAKQIIRQTKPPIK
jgi:hypothetical protein